MSNVEEPPVDRSTGDPSPQTTSAPPAEPAPSKRGRATTPADPLRHSRTSAVWLFVLGLLIVLTLLIILILQNTQKVTVSFLGWDGTLPLSAALLIAAAGGILLTAIAGSLRILQLRRRVKRT